MQWPMPYIRGKPAFPCHRETPDAAPSARHQRLAAIRLHPVREPAGRANTAIPCLAVTTTSNRMSASVILATRHLLARMRTQPFAFPGPGTGCTTIARAITVQYLCWEATVAAFGSEEEQQAGLLPLLSDTHNLSSAATATTRRPMTWKASG